MKRKEFFCIFIFWYETSVSWKHIQKKKKAETKKKQKRKQLSREKVGKYLKALGGKYALTVL